MDNNDITLKEEQESQLKEAETLLSIEAAVKDRITRIEKLKEDMEAPKEMIQSYLENDSVYREHTEAAKAAAKQKSATKKQLLSQTTGRALVEKLDTLKAEMAELQEGLSYYLREYQQATGSNEIEGADGELRQIVYVAKLVRKTSLNK
jgi:hypothetical protein